MPDLKACLAIEVGLVSNLGTPYNYGAYFMPLHMALGSTELCMG